MKKNILVILILVVLIGFSYSLDTSSDEKTINLNSNGFIEFLKGNIGQQVSIYIKGADITFNGELINLYSDGIIIFTIFKQKIYIPKESIGYIEVKDNKKTKKEQKK